MMQLSKYNLDKIDPLSVEVPAAALLELPEKVLQFGTGVLLRALPDYFIDKANKQGMFNGRIVVVKSTGKGDSHAFDKQDNLYTVCERGVDNGLKKEKNIICSSISRVLSAKNDWNKVMECAYNPQMQLIISNTTEVGIELVNEDITRHPPASFPGKLLAFLFERFKAFNGSRKCGMVIVPTELIEGNGKKLESIVTELAYLNGLSEAFIDWLENCNRFCNSLVDRIVPGKPGEAARAILENELGYTDELGIMCETYRLWAIEGDQEVADRLNFVNADPGAVVAEDISSFRELKLRLLNGTHTLGCGVAFLAGFATVKNAMDHAGASSFLSELMKAEIAPSIPHDVLSADAMAFADRVLDRFRNPYIDHPWLNITVQYSSKMRMRVVPVLLRHYELFNNVPSKMAMGFAAFILFMKAVKTEKNEFFGLVGDDNYLIQDDKAGYFFKKWQEFRSSGIAGEVLRDIGLWGSNLSLLPGFTSAVQKCLDEIEEHGMASLLNPQQPEMIPV
jgi:tagaturonate reductase